MSPNENRNRSTLTVILPNDDPMGVDKASSELASVKLADGANIGNLKNRGCWRNLKFERGRNLLRPPNPVHRSGGGVRAPSCVMLQTARSAEGRRARLLSQGQ